MKFCMAMVALEQGKKVRAKSWKEDYYIFMDGAVLKSSTGSVIGSIDSVVIGVAWELYSESVKLNTLKEGESFMYNTRRYTVIPQYLKHHCGNMTADSVPVISDAKVFTSLFGNVVVRKV